MIDPHTLPVAPARHRRPTTEPDPIALRLAALETRVAVLELASSRAGLLRDFLTRISSRKFLLTLAAICAAVLAQLSGMPHSQFVAGVTAAVTIAYLFANAAASVVTAHA